MSENNNKENITTGSDPVPIKIPTDEEVFALYNVSNEEDEK